MSLIRYSCQKIDEDDIAEVVAVLKSSNLTQGPKIREFESALENFCQAPYAVACSSGTAALHLACLAAGIGPGDEVITTPNTFVASANCILYCGAKPVFADIDPRTYNISPAEIEKKITEKTRAVIPVHFAGQSCDMEVIRAIVDEAEKKFGDKIFIIEDASHALGSTYKGTSVGSCSYSDLSVMSFHAVKHITSGEGGCVLTRSSHWAKKLRCFRSHGITSTPEGFLFPERAFEQLSGEDGLLRTWYYEQQELGFNYRLTDIQSALGLSQLRKLSQFIWRRREIVSFYQEGFKNHPFLKCPWEDPNGRSNFHLYVLQIDFDRMGKSRPQLMKQLLALGVQTQVHYIPVHTQPYYQKRLGAKWGDFPVAEAYYQQCLSIPLYPAMTEEQVLKVITEIKKLIQEENRR